MKNFDIWYEKHYNDSIVPVMATVFVLLFIELSLLYVLFYFFVFSA